MKRNIFFVVVLLLGAAARLFAAAPTGWVCFAAGGDVYRVKIGQDRELIADNAGAKHACWSYDGSLIFFIQDDGDIYAMNNDGSNQRYIGSADDKSYSAIAAYRPENRSVLCVDGQTFYKINADDGNGKTEVASAGASVTGEIAISRDGTRIAFRSGDGGGGGRLKKLTVGGSPVGYAKNCSASLSPHGEYLTENGDSHADMLVYDWDGSGAKTLHAGSEIGKWDNQAFAVNSDTWICVLDDDSYGSNVDNKGTAVGIVSYSDEVHSVCSWSGSYTQYPRLFVGDLPPVSSPDTYELSVDNGTGDGSYAEGTEVTIDANTPSSGMMFDVWTGDISHVADVNAAQTSVTMPAADVAVIATYAAIPAFSLSVANGSGDGDYQKGEEVTISAAEPSSGMMFDAWTGDISHVANVNESQTTVTMPAADVSVTATYKALPTFALSVTNGEGDGDYTEGAQVTITADSPASGMMFDAWTGDIFHVADVNSSQTTVTMPAGNVSVTATYKEIPASQYALSVTSGSGDGSYEEGAVVAIAADSPADGMMFDAWTGDISHIADVNAAQTSITMPAADVAVTAAYKALPTFALSVTNGEGDGDYTEGAQVTITADSPASGMMFDAWTGDISHIADANAAQTSITMPAADVAITATYTEIPASHFSLDVVNGSGDGSYEEGAEIAITADEPEAGKVFEAWIGDVSYVSDVNAPQTTVGMPAADISVTATYAEAPAAEYALTVINGSGDGNYSEGALIEIRADDPPAGKVFDQWTCDVGAFSDGAASITSFTMPQSDAIIEALYKDEPVSSDPTAITSPQDGEILEEDDQIILSAQGAGLHWSYDANSDGLGEVEIGDGNDVVFVVPTGITGPRTITIFCMGDNGNDTIDCQIAYPTAALRQWTQRRSPGCYVNQRGVAAAIVFSVAKAQRVTLTIYDIRGKAIRMLTDQTYAPGIHAVAWDGYTASGQRIGRGLYTAVLRDNSGLKNWKIMLSENR